MAGKWPLCWAFQWESSWFNSLDVEIHLKHSKLSKLHWFKRSLCSDWSKFGSFNRNHNHIGSNSCVFWLALHHSSISYSCQETFSQINFSWLLLRRVTEGRILVCFLHTGSFGGRWEVGARTVVLEVGGNSCRSGASLDGWELH